MSKNKKIFISIAIVALISVSSGAIVLGYSLYQDDWHMSDLQKMVKDTADYTKYRLSEYQNPGINQEAQSGSDLKEILRKSCFGTSINKKLKDSAMRCYVSLDNQFEGQQGVVDWQKGTKKEWEDKIVFPETSKEEMLIEEFTASDGSIWTVAVKPVSPNLAKAVEENLNDLIAKGKYNQ